VLSAEEEQFDAISTPTLLGELKTPTLPAPTISAGAAQSSLMAAFKPEVSEVGAIDVCLTELTTDGFDIFVNGVTCADGRGTFAFTVEFIDTLDDCCCGVAMATRGAFVDAATTAARRSLVGVKSPPLSTPRPVVTFAVDTVKLPSTATDGTTV
jgi:hypothetical protein